MCSGPPSHLGRSMNSATPRRENPMSLAAEPNALSYARVNPSTQEYKRPTPKRPNSQNCQAVPTV